MKIKQYLLEPRFTFNRIQLNLLTIVLLWCGMVGGSYLTLNKIIKSRATNDTTKQWVFSLATADDYTASNTIVDELGARPAESNNLFTNYSFEVGTSSWVAKAEAPVGWVEVPGSVGVGTSNFLVMKYEAKAFDIQTSAVVFDGGANYAGGWAGANTQTRYRAVSTIEGRPWVYIAQNHGTEYDAIEACSAVTISGRAAHLINNSEWMTVARNAEQVDSNWTNSVVGNGALVRGNSNGSLSLNGASALSGINRRTLNLSNGSVVWDIAGNVYDWTSAVQTTEVNTTAGWVEWNSANVAVGARQLYGPSDVGYLSAQGMGQIYGGALGNGFLRGGYWSNGSNAGAFALNLGYSPADRSNNLGFRCASDSVAISQSNLSIDTGRVSGRANLLINSSFVDGKIVQEVNVGSSASYDLTAFVYNQTSGEDGDEIDDLTAVIYFNGSTIPTTKYSDAGNGWWKLTATGTGTSALAEYGVLVKAGKTVKVDDFYLTKSTNRFNNPSFSEGTSNWKMGAVSGSSTPTGWIVVPGNESVGTSDFLVMKYEAKAFDTQTSAVVADGGAGSADGWAGANDQTRYQAVSRADGRPWVRIAQSHSTEFDGIEACRAVTVGSTNAHLITNNEWMTITNNAEQQTNNWSLGAIGSGYLYAGHNDGGPNNSLQASTNDNYRCAYTDTAGTTENLSPCPSNTANNTSGSGTNQIRTFKLSNNESIWDIAGNVWEWNSSTIQRKDQPYSWNGSVGATLWDYSDFDSGSSAKYIQYYKIGSSLQQNNLEPASLSYVHNATFGLGRLYNYSNGTDTDTTVYGYVRGGFWSNGSGAGAFALGLPYSPAYRNYYIGFRCASDSVAISQSYSSNKGRDSGSGQKIIAPVITDSKSYQTINIGDTASYNFSAYVYDETTGNIAGTVNDSIAQLLVDGTGVGATYTDVGSGWWKLSTVISGATSQKEYGVLVKSGKTVYIDDLSLNKVNVKTVFVKTAYTNNKANSWDSFTASAIGGSNATIKYQFCTTDGTTCEANIGTTNTTWQYWNGSSWTTATNSLDNATFVSDLGETAMKALSITSKKIAVKAIMSYEGDDVPTINSFTVGLTTDVIPPTNATALVLHKDLIDETCDFEDNCWTKSSGPTFSWLAGSDEENGSEMKGYCLYLGTDSVGNPAQSKGKLGTSPVPITNTPCQFIVSATEINLSTAGYLATALSNSDVFTSAPNTYFLNIKAVDNAGNPATENLSIRFRYDGTRPTNVSYISPASGNFSNVTDMSFSWPIANTGAAIDNQSGILGWQYQVNSTEGTWKGSVGSSEFGLEYIPSGTGSYYLTSRDVVETGNNVIYFRTVDKAGNVSDDGSIRTGNLSYGGDAPTFLQTDMVTITPDVSTANSFALSWPSASASNDNNVKKYYYMVTQPPATLTTLQGNPTTYIDNGTATTVALGALPNVNKGANTIYVVAIDDETPSNYSPSNYITGTFNLNSNSPDNVGDLVASDSSIKSQSQWNVTLTWTAPTYKGAGNLTYQVYRSSDGITFALVGTSSGLSYVDNAPSSAKYYYKIYTKDGANAVSSGTNAVYITPTGKWTSAPSLSTGPDAGSITTRKGVITWSTSRNSDSKIQYGTTSNSYGDVEPSNSSQVTSHSIQLSGLQPGTTYYYKAKWTDEDGNTGTSDEKSFKTQDAPTVKDVSAGGIGLETATIQFTSTGSSKVKIYYGTTTGFGGVKSLDTATSETSYTVALTGLSDGTKYYYKINTIDSDGYEYEGTVLDFTTLPRPRISKVELQEMTNTAQTTVKVTWISNTDISSIITFYPEGESGSSRDQVDINLQKGEHEMTIGGLLPQTNYILVVKGRDKIGNEAISDSQKFTTSSDSRPPAISGVKVEGSTIPAVSSTAQESVAQLVVSWNTDEPATSQVEFGEGTGISYSQKTQEDTNLKLNHLVVISNLTPSKVYHLRTISKDKAENSGMSIDTVTITPRATDNALNLVLTNLSQMFSFLGGMIK